jgi:predicted alpha/beta superfamily hydrolase
MPRQTLPSPEFESFSILPTMPFSPLRASLALLLLAVAASASRGASVPAPSDAGAPVLIPRARQYDLTSKITGRGYRVFVSTPFNADPARKYPVFYVLDGNWYFGPTAINLTESSGGGTILPAIVVGIGYPSDDNDVAGARRGLDLTISADATDKDPTMRGGGDAFLRFINEEVKPFVAARYAVDATRQILYGKSLGGLMVVRQLFRDPSAYSTYIAASPALYRHNRDVLDDEAAFAQRVKAGEVRVRVLITAAGDEQYRGPDPKLRETADRTRRVDNAAELAARLAALNSDSFTASYALIPDENHTLVSLASIGRALGFALKP